MLKTLFVSLFFSLAFGLYSPSDDVISLSAGSFRSKVVQGEGVWLVEFYAPWCGHCKSLAPEWKKAASALKGVVNVAAVDLTVEENKPLGSTYGVEGFPTIKIFAGDKSKPETYQGARTNAAIVQAALAAAEKMVKAKLNGKGSSSSSSSSSSSKSSGSSGKSQVVELTEANFEEQVLKSKEPWLVEFFAPWCGHCKNLAPEWEEASKSLKGTLRLGAVDATVHSSLAARYGVNGYPTIKFFWQGDASDYQGGRTASEIVNWGVAKVETLDIGAEVYELTGPEVWQEHCSGSRICVVGVLPHIYDSSASQRNTYIDLLANVAKKQRKNPFVFLWAQGGDQQSLEQTTGINGYPALVGVAVNKAAYSLHMRSFTEDAINDFCKGLVTGKTRSSKFQQTIAIATVPAWNGKDAKPEL